MKNEVNVTVTGVHKHPGLSHEETTKTDARGIYHMKNGAHVVEYEEYLDNDGDQPDFKGGVATYNRVEITADRMRVIRHGSVESDLVFSQGLEHEAVYSTGFGKMKSHVNTRRYNLYMLEKGNRIIAEAEYTVSMNGMEMSDVLMRIDISG